MSLTLRLGTKASNDLAGGMDADLTAIEHLQAENIEVLRLSSPRCRLSACSHRSSA
jgi:hypothetical protein